MAEGFFVWEASVYMAALELRPSTGRAFKAKDDTSDRESRMVPASSYNFEGEILMYDNIVCFISYTEDEEFALSLESKAIAKTLRMIWQIVWNAGY